MDLQIWENVNAPIRVTWGPAGDAQLPPDWRPLPIPNANPYPKLWGNINLAPLFFYNPSQLLGLGSAWRHFITLPDVPPVTLTPISRTSPVGGGPNNFAVSVDGYGVSGTWFPDKDASATWLTVIAPATPQTVSGNVTYNAAANAGPPRSANIYINGKTFTVNQDGA